MSLETPVSVPLPRPRPHPTLNPGLTTNRPPVWAIDPSELPVQIPPPAQCAHQTNEREVCCQELKGDDERQLIDPDVVRDV